MKVSSVAWSLLGLGTPPVAALIFIPLLLSQLGAERFGLLSLIWAFTALSGLLDLGIGRATTKAVADLQVGGDTARMHSTVAAALRVTLLSGAFGAVLVLLSLTLDLRQIFSLQSVSADQMTTALVLLAAVVPIQAMAATYRGIAEGLQQFREISLVRMALGSANFVAPWAAACFSQDLGLLTLSLVLTRALALLAFRAIARRHLPATTASIDRASVRLAAPHLLRSGGWLSISAIVSPLLVQADRFAIAAIVSAAAVTSYAIPFDLITQLLIISSAITTVALPSLSAQLARDPAEARRTFVRWALGVALLMALATGLTAALLPWLLPLWLGHDLPPESIAIGRWLCLGVWINGLGGMFYSWLHAHGRFRATALLHLAELPFYALTLFVLLQHFGVLGAALAWVLRVGVDTLVLFAMSRRGQPAAQAKVTSS